MAANYAYLARSIKLKMLPIFSESEILHAYYSHPGYRDGQAKCMDDPKGCRKIRPNKNQKRGAIRAVVKVAC